MYHQDITSSVNLLFLYIVFLNILFVDKAKTKRVPIQKTLEQVCVLHITFTMYICICITTLLALRHTSVNLFLYNVRHKSEIKYSSQSDVFMYVFSCKIPTKKCYKNTCFLLKISLIGQTAFLVDQKKNVHKISLAETDQTSIHYKYFGNSLTRNSLNFFHLTKRCEAGTGGGQAAIFKPELIFCWLNNIAGWWTY